MVLLSFSAIGQKTGNIVEIFGKEKVETTYEGKVIHTFTSGLILRGGVQPGLINGYRNIVFWQIAKGLHQQPEAGQELQYKYRDQAADKPLVWEPAIADSTGKFVVKEGRSLLYTTYFSPVNTIALLDASGHTRVYINGMPHEGDHYDYGYTLIPFRLKKGNNDFYYTYGRFSRYTSKIVIPAKPVMFSPRDMTLPSVLRDENPGLLGAVRVINASEKPLKAHTIECELSSGEKASMPMDEIIPLTTRKVKFSIPAYRLAPMADTLSATLVIKDAKGLELDRINITLKVHESTKHHERTFISGIDGSVQYFSIAPSLSRAEGQALVLTVHGASVEATNQSRAYRQKDWGHIVAPTNRRPFGFNWEEWGRIDALEVLAEAKRIYRTLSSETYLTGHSMGGHGSWFLGATYPDHWAAVAPCAGYPDITGYRRAGADSVLKSNPHFAMLERGASGGRVLKLAKNYLQSGVYVLHGSADAVVPVEQARSMRQLLGTFHDNFAYYEYPGGSHWYGDHSVDWPPLFDFMRQNKIPEANKVDSIWFTTAAPAISATNYWLRINQQIHQYQTSSVKVVRTQDTINVTPENIAGFSILSNDCQLPQPKVVIINGQQIITSGNDNLHFVLKGESWVNIAEIDKSHKHAARQGGFKLAFDRNVVFVYATHGTSAENQWYENKARFDAETFLYRGNSSVDIIPDKEFSVEKYKGRNIIIYGNASNNSAWKPLLSECPVQVTKNGISFGDEKLPGENLGTYFIYPNPFDDYSLTGVVAGTGEAGMKAASPNDYFSGITGFPDLLIFNTDWLKDNPEGIIKSGFFGNDWQITTGEFSH